MKSVLIFICCISSGVALAQHRAETADTAASSIYEQAVSSSTRLAGDTARDAGRKPAAVLEFMGIEPGDTVLDMFSGGGYYSELLSLVVGADGKVVAQTNEAYIGFVGDEFSQRYAGDRLANVEVLMAENNSLQLAGDQFDAIIMMLAYHDVYHEDIENGWPKIEVAAFLAELKESLKSDGIVGVVDHAADAGAPAETGNTLHRIDPARVIADFTAAGFVLDGKSDLLRNSDDDHTMLVFDPSIRGKTDRFILRFRKN
jgi:predicted methyltransferase